MEGNRLLDALARGRTDLLLPLIEHPDAAELQVRGPVSVARWLVHYGDLTALRLLQRHGGGLALDLDEELGNAAFHGHWKVCDFLIGLGADVAARHPQTGETALHAALCKAGRPAYLYVVRRLLEAGADPNARTCAGAETGAFMRDVRCRGETPLHRAAAFADEAIIEALLTAGADREARDAHGDTPLSWASWHLRPAAVLALLVFPPHRIHPAAVGRYRSDHGAGWGNALDWGQLGDYLPDALT